ncbi:MAG: carbon storage regulator CsrA [Desulfobacteraceae bacterium]|nr:carbon storage regulator CsrA [Desulfobacteraceae bacterium]
MLVLTRKVGEGILIGEDIKITILENQEGKIRIGIEAPEEQKIYRQEVYDRICRENREASQWDTSKIEVLNSVLPRKRWDK